VSQFVDIDLRGLVVICICCTACCIAASCCWIWGNGEIHGQGNLITECLLVICEWFGMLHDCSTGSGIQIGDARKLLRVGHIKGGWDLSRTVRDKRWVSSWCCDIFMMFARPHAIPFARNRSWTKGRTFSVVAWKSWHQL